MNRHWLMEDIPVSRGTLIFVVLLLVSGMFPPSDPLNGLVGLYVLFWGFIVLRDWHMNRKAWAAIRARNKEVNHTHPWED